MDVVRLRDEERREGAVHHRAVEVERVAHRHHEAGDLALHAEAVERVEDLRIRGFGTRGRERKHERFLDERQQPEDAAPQKREAREHQQAPQQKQAEIEIRHEDGELQQDGQPVDRDGGGHRGEHGERRELHHVAGDLQHHVRKLIDRGEQDLAFIAERGERDAEEHRENDDLQDLVVGHRFGERARHHVADEVLQREFRGREIRRCADVGQRQAQVVAGSEQIRHQQAEQQGNERGGDEPAQRLGEHTPDGGRVAHVRDADDQRGKHERPDQHLDEPQKDVRHERRCSRRLPWRSSCRGSS